MWEVVIKIISIIQKLKLNLFIINPIYLPSSESNQTSLYNLTVLFYLSLSFRKLTDTFNQALLARLYILVILEAWQSFYGTYINLYHLSFSIFSKILEILSAINKFKLYFLKCI